MHIPNVAKSANFAFSKHLGQFRDDAKTPFFTHLVSVTGFLIDSGISSPDVLSSGYLHDVVEDTDTSIDDISREFGSSIASIVHKLTDPPGVKDLAARDCQLDRARNSWFCANSAAIKIADKTANILDTLNAPWPNSKRFEYLNSSISIVDAIYFSLKSRRILNENVVWLWTNFREQGTYVATMLRDIKSE